MSDWTILHNPRCSKSRQTLELLRSNDIDPTIIEYLKQSLSESDMLEISKKLKLRPKDFVRKKEDDFKAIDLDLEDDKAVIKAMIAYPKIIERPIVIHKDKAILGRPPENIKKLL